MACAAYGRPLLRLCARAVSHLSLGVISSQAGGRRARGARQGEWMGACAACASVEAARVLLPPRLGLTLRHLGAGVVRARVEQADASVWRARVELEGAQLDGGSLLGLGLGLGLELTRARRRAAGRGQAGRVGRRGCA